MISDDDLMDLLSNLEADWVERTVSTTNSDKFSEAICAFANDFTQHRGAGYLLIGVDDKGRPAGLTVTDRLLLNISALRSSGKILPLPLMSVERRVLPTERHEIVVVEVSPSDMTPVRFDGRVWIRVGPSKAVATECEERVLTERRAAFMGRTFDARPCREAMLSDISLDMFSLSYLPEAIAEDVLAENHRDIEYQLASLRFHDQKHGCPTNAGVLLFGKSPLDFLPGAYVQFVRYAGSDPSADIVSDMAISGDLLSILRQLVELVKLHIESHPEAVSILQEKTVASYPFEAVREVLMNAIMHRNYDGSTAPVSVNWFDDRIEISNPGGLFGEATAENFPTQTAYRNPVIAEAMKNLGFVNRFGRGIHRARAAMEKNGSPAMEHRFDAHYVLTVLRRHP